MKRAIGLHQTLLQVLVTFLLLFVWVWGVRDFVVVAAGTQNWVGKFTLTWGGALAGLVVIGVMASLLSLLNTWSVQWVYAINKGLARLRERSGWFRWLLVVAFALIPMKIILYTPLGAKLMGVGFRLLMFMMTAAIMGFLASRKKERLIDWSGILTSLVVLGCVFGLGKAFVSVVDLPISLTWSEGNRIWDYSILFGRERYNYPQDQPIEAYIDRERQTLWGLPFLLPGVSIYLVRLWSSILFTVPYALLGWMSFRSVGQQRNQWFWLGAWSFLYLSQGPIYTPLILSAILVAGARHKPLWLALPLIFLAGHYAQSSRITWMIGPAIWAVMIALVDFLPTKQAKFSLKYWSRVAVYGLAGFFGGFGIIRGWMRLYNYITRAAISKAEIAATPVPDMAFISPGDSVEMVSSASQNTLLSNQALLWERLLPNPTYNLGIILGLILAAGPVLILLVYLVRTKQWPLNLQQQTGIFGCLAVLMGLGIIFSTKIGGGGDLHNLDMFFVGSIFVMALAWDSGGYKLITGLDGQSIRIKWIALLAVAIPTFMPWAYAEPLTLPPEDKTAWTLELLQYETERVLSEGGEILFMDQRQLLTFGYLGDIPLVPEYEKKLVMDRAMSGDSAYFEQFYRDIAMQRFALIVTDPQRIRFSAEDEGWGAENDTWVEWVTKPLLCYYEPAYTIKKTGVWLLKPILEPGECSYP